MPPIASNTLKYNKTLQQASLLQNQVKAITQAQNSALQEMHNDQ